MHYRFIDNIAEITAQQWNAVTGTDYPFLRHEFLYALEASGSVSTGRGWQVQHLLVEDNGMLVAILPLYIKTHSYGEYVFDWSWAEAYQRHGLDYYPKLLSAIPFSPVTGPRLATTIKETHILMPLLKQALSDRARALGASGWHVLFPANDELLLWQASDIASRSGCQFHWHNHGFHHFDDFLATFSSRKRKDVKKERQRIVDQGIRLQQLTGAQITGDHWQHFFRFYQNTYARKSGHGGYLTQGFFQHLQQSMPEQLLLVMAYQNDRPIAAALNLFSGDTLYGRYWGASEEVPGLHFETCYYQGIEFCIAQGLKRFDAGAQGEHKIQRGFVPVITHSVHWIAHPQFRNAIIDFVQQEAQDIKHYQQNAAGLLPFRRAD